MGVITLGNRKYEVDFEGFLEDSSQWDENFAVQMAPRLGIESGLTEAHWQIINFIRSTFAELGKCPLVYQTCRLNGLRIRDLQELFPSGYLRGACKLAGITYREGYLGNALVRALPEEVTVGATDKVYEVDARGFLVNHKSWDEQYATNKAFEMKMPDGLTEKHWQIIRFLRDAYRKTSSVPTVYETCEVNKIEIDELERLFPDGYHRGAVKLAGLRAR
jgi:tRNA 2-thiouridine synthesizing protein E